MAHPPLTLAMQHAYFAVIDKNLALGIDKMQGRYDIQREAYEAMMLAAKPTPTKHEMLKGGWGGATAMKQFEIWTEGYAATGGSSCHQLICTQVGINFKDACVRAHIAGKLEGHGNYDPVGNTVWGCRLFDNASDAAKSFG